jgi:formylglycine-generating enzyme required for sulfatase activity
VTDDADTGISDAESMVDAGPCMQPPVVQSCDAGMCRIPAGCFLMGSPDSEPGHTPPEPLVEVSLTHDFEIGAHEVTQAEWIKAGFPNPSLAANPYSQSCSDPDCPVSNVTWFEALAYSNSNYLSSAHNPPLKPCYALSNCNTDVGNGMVCTAALAAPSAYECEGYRLPIEAEWEYAARAGTHSAFFSGDMLPQSELTACVNQPNLDPIGWYCDNAGKSSHPVARKRANAWGLFDTSGNVGELTFTAFWRYPGGGRQIDPGGLLGVRHDRISRGGRAADSAFWQRSAVRALAVPDDNRNVSIGFRIARTIGHQP